MIKISSYNCQSSKRNTGGIQKLCDDSDVVFLQEHWLYPEDLPSLNNVHEDFISFAISSMDASSGLTIGRPFGGVGVLWRKALSSYVKPVTYDDDRIIGLEYNKDGARMLLMSVYLPCCSHQNFDSFVYYLAKLKTIIDDFSSPYICVLGDFNADIGKGTEFGNELQSFCNSSQLFVVDVMNLPPSSMTHVNDGHGTESWLDHVVCTKGFTEVINAVEIDYSILSSDHFPVSIIVDVQGCEINCDTHATCMDDRWVVDWGLLGSDDLHAFESAVSDNLRSIVIPDDLLTCEGCASLDHTNVIETYYDQIVTCIRNASEKTIGRKVGGKSRKVVPGWNELVEDKHILLNDLYALWSFVGKPKCGYIFDQLRLARSRFKYALRFCLRNEKELRAKSLADKLVRAPCSMAVFWKEVRRLNCSPPLAPSINGVTGESNIADMWKEHFSGILNSVDNPSCKVSVLHKLSLDDCELLPFSVGEVTKAIKELSSGRSGGNDHLCAEHFKYAGNLCAVHLSLCLTLMVRHEFLPPSLTKVVLVPIVKDKNGKLTEKNNYRPIAIASVCSKILERIILNRSSVQLSTGHHQFGFKERHSTDMAIYALKEITDYYLRNDSPVFICYLDASKAFDRVNHWKLLDKLLCRGMNSRLVKLIAFWYKSQRFHVRWGSSVSAGFNVSNGVRQGGILSPFLFNVYTDDLSDMLNRCGYGCHYLGSVNHLYYADDMVLLSPTPFGLQQMLHICERYAKDHDILFNSTKTVCMAMLPKRFGGMHVPTILLCGHRLSFVSTYKYLGYQVSNDFSRADDLEIRQQYRALCCRANSLIRKFAMCTHSVKKCLYNAYCSNVSYIHLWHSYHLSDLRKFKVCFNNAARMFFGYERLQISP